MEKGEIESTNLDSLYKKNIVENLDFIKIDTQGAELEILKGGLNLLNERILGIQVETEFKPIYRSQPLFADVDSFIRNQLGLELVDIRKAYWKYNEGKNIGPVKGQLIFGDALYFRDPYQLPRWCEQFSELEARNKLVMACFMGMIYGYPDYSLCLLAQPKVGQWMSADVIRDLKSLVMKDARSLRYSGKGRTKIWMVLRLLEKFFEPDYEGWAAGEPHLGSVKKFGIFT